MAIDEIAAKLAILERIGRDLDEILWQGNLLALELALRAYNPDQPRVPAGNSDGGQWTIGGEERGPRPSAPAPEPFRGNAGLSSTDEAIGDPNSSSDRSSESRHPPDGVELVQYRGVFHDQVRDDLTQYLKTRGFNVETEVALTLPTHPLTTAYIDLLVQNPKTGIVYAVEVKTGVIAHPVSGIG